MKRYQIILLFFTFAISVAAFAVNFMIERQISFWQESPGDKILTELNSVKIFLSNSKVDAEGLYCEKTYSVERQLPSTAKAGDESYLGELAYFVLSELLKGPTETERDNGFFTSINQGARVRRIVIKDKTASVDFNEELDRGVARLAEAPTKRAGSCMVQAIQSQITETLKQFSEIREVVISVEGRSEEVLQP